MQSRPLRRVASRVAKVVRPALRAGARAASMRLAAPSVPASREPSAAIEAPYRAPEKRRRRSLPLTDAPSIPPRAAPRDRVRILLYNPPRYRGINVVRMYRSEYLFVDDNPLPPTDLGYFAAAAKPEADVAFVDANAEVLDDAAAYARIEQFRPDVIVVRGVLDLLDHELRVPRWYAERHPHAKVVLACRGAIDAEDRLFEEMPFLDGLARGEIDAFAEDLAAGVPLADIRGMSVPGARDPTVRVVEDLNRHPIPDLDVMPNLWGTGYRLPYYGVRSGYLLVTARGCPYPCTYCMVGGIDGRPFTYRRRDPENVVEEVRMLQRRFGIEDFYVWDEIFTNPHGVRISERFLEEGLDLHWLCEGKPDLVQPDMLRTMARAGCKAIYYGVESGDDGILSDVHKGHDTRDAARAIRLTKEAGITCATYMMVGFPNETWQSYARTLRFLFETEPDLIRYCFLVPYPVTVLHREMVARGLLAFDRANLDRRISPHHDAEIAVRTHRLGPWALRAMDLLFKQVFADELTRTPPASDALRRDG